MELNNMKSCKYFTGPASAFNSFDNLEKSEKYQFDVLLDGQNNCACSSVYSQLPTKVATCPFNIYSQDSCMYYEPEPSKVISIAVDNTVESSSIIDMFVALTLSRQKYGFISYEIYSGRYLHDEGISDINLLIEMSKNSAISSYDESDRLTPTHGYIYPEFRVDEHIEILSIYNQFCEINTCTSNKITRDLMREVEELFSPKNVSFLSSLLDSSENLDAPI